MEVDFYRLERPIQDRFSDATRSIGLPAPILWEAPPTNSGAPWLLLAVSVSIALVWSGVHGFGHLDSSLAIAPVAFAAGYAVAVAAITYCLLRVFAGRSARASIPYRPGLFLFPAGVFDARHDPIRVFLHPELKGASVVDGTRLRVSSNQGEFLFRLPDAGAAEQARDTFERARDMYEQAARTEHRREQAMLDPLVDSGFSSPFSPKQRLGRRLPWWAKAAVPVALVVGVVAGPALWKLRNVGSEQRMFNGALASGTVESFRAYLARGGPRAEVSKVLLPRAELRRAMNAGTVEALEDFERTHPDTRIGSEVEGALQAAVTAALGDVTKAGTVTALRDFKARRARYAFIQPAADAAIVALYRGLAKKFVAGKDPVVASLFERLLGYSKVHGPHVSIRFARRTPDSVAAADQLVKMSAYFMGKQSVPSQYYTGDYATKRESASGEQIAAAINAPFPADVLHAEVVPPLVGQEPLPAPTEPTLFIDYAPDMAGGYMSDKPRGVFVGVGMTFKASFLIPKDNQPLEMKSSLWRAPNPQILRSEGTGVADVYEKMASESFGKFTRDFLTLLGQKPEGAPEASSK
ncbi:MAG TPA: hypothetical protein VHU80_01675 [Polyangiaceae bacterium]|jgi:hypothetical protein|nr:hypothetical protein [Polyangiaceae bacterium]